MTPEQAYYKAIELGKRIPEFEPVVSEDAYFSFYYAHHIIKGKFILAEPIMSKNTYYSYLYAKHVIKGRWELGEAAISRNAKYSYLYAKYAIEGKLPDFMHNQMILENNKYTKLYIKFIQ